MIRHINLFLITIVETINLKSITWFGAAFRGNSNAYCRYYALQIFSLFETFFVKFLTIPTALFALNLKFQRIQINWTTESNIGSIQTELIHFYQDLPLIEAALKLTNRLFYYNLSNKLNWHSFLGI